MRLYKRKRRKAGRRSVKIYMLSLYSCVEGYSWTSVANLLKIDASSRHRLPSKNLITFYKSRATGKVPRRRLWSIKLAICRQTKNFR